MVSLCHDGLRYWLSDPVIIKSYSGFIHYCTTTLIIGTDIFTSKIIFPHGVEWVPFLCENIILTRENINFLIIKPFVGIFTHLFS